MRRIVWAVVWVVLSGRFDLQLSADEAWPDVRPAAMSSDRATVKLPSRISAPLILAASGRLLICRLDELRVAAVVDVSELKIKGYVPLSDRKGLLAAGREVLVQVNGETGAAERWSLRTLKKESQGNLGVSLPIAGIGLGAASSGPLLVAPERVNPKTNHYDLHLFDSSDWSQTVVAESVEMRIPAQQRLIPESIFAADDGSLFVSRRSGVVRLGKGTPVVKWVAVAGGGNEGLNLRPGSSANYLLGLPFPLNANHESVRLYDSVEAICCVPGCASPFYLQVVGSLNRSKKNKEPPLQAHVFLEGELRRLGTLTLGMKTAMGSNTRPPSQDWALADEVLTRLRFIPAARVLAWRSDSGDQLEFQRVDVPSLLKASGRQYLTVTSPASDRADAGREFRHAIRCLSSGERLTFSVEDGPQGMSISETGVVSWSVPAESRTSSTDALILIGNGQREVFHRLRLDVRGRSPQESAAAPTALAEKQIDVAKAVPELQPVESPKFDGERKTVALSAPVSDVMVGGGGRFLVLHFPSLKRLGIFDVNAAKVVRYLPLPPTEAVFAAGLRAVVIGDRQWKRLERWSLATFEREAVVNLDLPRQFSVALMGADQDDELILGLGEGDSMSEFVILDAHTFQRRGPTITGRPIQWRYQPTPVRISANGRLITAWQNNSTPNGVTAFVRNGDGFTKHYEHKTGGILSPFADGQHFGSLLGILSDDLGSTAEPLGYAIVPAVSGPMYLTVSDQKGPREQSEVVRLMMLGDQRPIATVEGLARMGWEPTAWLSITPFDKSLWFLPSAKLIVQRPFEGHQLVLLRFDPEQAWERSGRDYLYVDSPPPREARLGQAWSYPLQVRSKKGSVKYRLSIAPSGMNVDESGVVSWTVPEQYSSDAEPVAVAINDASGQEIVHSFSLKLPQVTQQLAARRAQQEKDRAAEMARQEAAKLLAKQRADEERKQQAEANKRKVAERQAELATLWKQWRIDREKIIAAEDAGKPPRPLPTDSGPRTWVDATGTNKIQATLSEFFGETIVLKRSNGTDLSLKLTELSEADRQFLKARQEAQRSRMQRLAERDRRREAEQGDRDTRLESLRTSSHRLKRIGDALLEYHKQHAGYPPALSIDPQWHEPLLSWRVHLLPALGHKELHAKFRLDEPWFSEHNRALIAEMPNEYRVPGFSEAARESGQTAFLAVVGHNAAFPRFIFREEAKRVPWVLQGLNYSRDFPDGIHQTIAVVEASEDLAVSWTRPEEFPIDDYPAFDVLHGFREDGFLALFAGGKTQLVSRSALPELVRPLFTRDRRDSIRETEVFVQDQAVQSRLNSR